jgi:hypothetical protein
LTAAHLERGWKCHRTLPCVRQRSTRRTRCRKHSETFRWNPVGNQSHPVELAGSRKRVWRGPGQPWLRSVDSECLGPAIEPRKNAIRGSPRRHSSGGRVGVPYGLACRSCRGPRTGHQHRRILQEPERSHRLHGDTEPGAIGTQDPRPAGTVTPCGSETRHGNRGSAKRRKRSAA